MISVPNFPWILRLNFERVYNRFISIIYLLLHVYIIVILFYENQQIIVWAHLSYKSRVPIPIFDQPGTEKTRAV